MLGEHVRPEVHHLATWAPIGSDIEWDDVDDAELDAFIRDIRRVQPPVTTEERQVLLRLLDRPHEDSLYGVLNLVVALLESAPETGWQLDLPTTDRPWFEYLRSRWLNYLDQQDERLDG